MDNETKDMLNNMTKNSQARSKEMSRLFAMMTDQRKKEEEESLQKETELAKRKVEKDIKKEFEAQGKFVPNGEVDRRNKQLKEMLKNICR